MSLWEQTFRVDQGPPQFVLLWHLERMEAATFCDWNTVEGETQKVMDSPSVPQVAPKLHLV